MSSTFSFSTQIIHKNDRLYPWTKQELIEEDRSMRTAVAVVLAIASAMFFAETLLTLPLMNGAITAISLSITIILAAVTADMLSTPDYNSERTLLKIKEYLEREPLYQSYSTLSGEKNILAGKWGMGSINLKSLMRYGLISRADYHQILDLAQARREIDHQIRFFERKINQRRNFLTLSEEMELRSEIRDLIAKKEAKISAWIDYRDRVIFPRFNGISIRFSK